MDRIIPPPCKRYWFCHTFEEKAVLVEKQMHQVQIDCRYIQPSNLSIGVDVNMPDIPESALLRAVQILHFHEVQLQPGCSA